MTNDFTNPHPCTTGSEDLVCYYCNCQLKVGAGGRSDATNFRNNHKGSHILPSGSARSVYVGVAFPSSIAGELVASTIDYC